MTTLLIIVLLLILLGGGGWYWGGFNGYRRNDIPPGQPGWNSYWPGSGFGPVGGILGFLLLIVLIVVLLRFLGVHTGF